MDLLESFQHARHPWELRRAAFFREALRRALPVGRTIDVLDCGAGDAYFANGVRALAGVRTVTCWDANYDATLAARLAEQYPSLAFTKSRPQGRFGLAVLLDVLEHVEDDRAFLGEIVESSLTPDGLVLASVPAWQSLFTRHDTFLRHHRRYRPSQLADVVTRCGLRVLAQGGVFHSLVFPRAVTAATERAMAVLGRALPPLTSSTASWEHGQIVTGAVTAMLHVDNLVSHQAAALGVNLPGLSTWVLATRGAA